MTFACRANRRQVPSSFFQMFVKRCSTVCPATLLSSLAACRLFDEFSEARGGRKQITGIDRLGKVRLIAGT